MSKTRRTVLAISLAVIAAACLVSATKLPLWHLRMEAPQYREQEALKVNVLAGSMNGDLREITVLNQYIGVHVPEVLPQSKWLPKTLIIGAALGVLASLLPFVVRRGALLVTSIALAGAIGVAVFQAKQQMYDIGHKRDAHTKLARVQDFTPPFLGTAKVAQFTITAWFGTGAYLLGAAIALQLGAAAVSRRSSGANCCCKKSQPVGSPQTSEALA
jgi:copper chaperone NosL